MKRPKALSKKSLEECINKASEEMRKMVGLEELEKCFKCKKPMIPDKKAVIDGTKKWDGHTWKYNCKCNNKDLRLSIG